MMDNISSDQTRRGYHQELDELKQQIQVMGSMAADMLADAVQAVGEVNEALADSVIRHDETIDAQDANIEARCVRIIALQQPLAEELRFVVSSLKIITDIERIGDHAVDIARLVLPLVRGGLTTSPLDIDPIAQTVLRMLDRAGESISDHIEDLRPAMIDDAKSVRVQLEALQQEIFAMTANHRLSATNAIRLHLAAVYLERVAAHAMNIAERTDYIATGELTPFGREDTEV
jgi:phosphate transport system protein